MENTDAAGVRPVPLHNPQPSVNGYGTRMSYASKVLNSILGSHSESEEEGESASVFPLFVFEINFDFERPQGVII